MLSTSKLLHRCTANRRHLILQAARPHRRSPRRPCRRLRRPPAPSPKASVGCTCSQGTFNTMSAFNQAVDSWDTSSVTSMFVRARAPRRPSAPPLTPLACVGLTRRCFVALFASCAAQEMFSGASSFNQVLNFDTSSVTSMGVRARAPRRPSAPPLSPLACAGLTRWCVAAPFCLPHRAGYVQGRERFQPGAQLRHIERN